MLWEPEDSTWFSKACPHQDCYLQTKEADALYMVLSKIFGLTNWLSPIYHHTQARKLLWKLTKAAEQMVEYDCFGLLLTMACNPAPNPIGPAASCPRCPFLGLKGCICIRTLEGQDLTNSCCFSCRLADLTTKCTIILIIRTGTTD